MARADRMVREFAVEVEWVPFELHSEVPPEGETKDKAYQSRADGRDRLHALAAADGLPMQFNPVRSNGHKALEAAEWAREQGPDVFDAVHRALFRAYFADAANISTIDQVDSAVAAAGLPVDRAALRRALEAGSYAPLVDEYTQLARQNGINSTPTFILGGEFVVSGAQDWNVFAATLSQLGVPQRAGVEPGPDGLGPDAPPLIGPESIHAGRGAPPP